MGKTEEVPTITQWHEYKELAGPYPMGLRASVLLNGDSIEKTKLDTGYFHKGIEKVFENTPWFAATVIADRVCPEDAVFYELAFCLAVEDMTHTQVSRRAQIIRVILCELNRIARHLEYLEKIAVHLKLQTAFHYISREKESLLNLFELLTGSRYLPNFFRVGGTRADITEGFIERVCTVCEQILVRIKEYERFMIKNEILYTRLSWLCPVTISDVSHYRISGPDARAAGALADVRKKHPYSGYELIQFSVPVGVGVSGQRGDAYDRLLVRVEEIKESIGMLLYLADNVPPGDFVNAKINKEFSVPMGEAYARVESSRGLLSCLVVADGTTKPARVQWNVPSLNKLELFTHVSRGTSVDDFKLAFSTFDISVVEVDR